MYISDITQYLDKSEWLNEGVLGRPYQLIEYKLHDKIKDKEFLLDELKPYEDKVIKSKIPGFIRNILKIQKYKTETIKIREKKENIYDENLLNIENDAWYIGYFQTPKYFEKYRSEILQLIELKKALSQENLNFSDKIKSVNSVSIHIRRTDYLNSSWSLGLDYYQRAIEYINARVENPVFFIFSDDLPWVEENLKILNNEKHFVNVNSLNESHFDLELMRNCKHNIIANSTFSWWGAWLNESPDKIVVAPKEKFEFASEILPLDWARV